MSVLYFHSYFQVIYQRRWIKVALYFSYDDASCIRKQLLSPNYLIPTSSTCSHGSYLFTTLIILLNYSELPHFTASSR